MYIYIFWGVRVKFLYYLYWWKNNSEVFIILCRCTRPLCQYLGPLVCFWLLNHVCMIILIKHCAFHLWTHARVFTNDWYRYGSKQGNSRLDYENCLTYLFITKKQLIITFLLYKKKFSHHFIYEWRHVYFCHNLKLHFNVTTF